MQPECPFLPTLRHIPVWPPGEARLRSYGYEAPGVPWLDKKLLFSSYTKNPFIMSIDYRLAGSDSLAFILRKLTYYF